MSFSFIHAADIHLGRKFSGIPEYFNENPKIFQTGVEDVLYKIVETAISKNVDFVLISGDTFDSDEADFSSKLTLKKAFQKLTDNNIGVYAVCGNHDPLNSYNKNTFNYDENSPVKIAGLNTELYGDIPVFGKDGVQICTIHTFGFKDDKFNDNPVKYLTPANKNFFNIGLIHCDINAAQDSDYAPCSLSELLALNYEYYALGHIHTPAELSDNAFYPGTVQGRNPKETGVHGIRYIEAESKQIIKNEFIPVDVVRYETVETDLSQASDITEAFDLISEQINIVKSSEILILRLNLTGFVDFYSDLNEEFYDTLSKKITDYFSNKVYIGRITNNTQIKTDENILKQDTGIIGEIMKTLSDNEIDVAYREISTLLKPVLEKCEFSPEEKELFEQQIKTETKEACINFCSKVYAQGGER